MIIGITAVALGTSLPELATSFNAARKNEFGLLLGNIFGSNILNIVFVFGSSLLINESVPGIVNYSLELILFLGLTILLILLTQKDVLIQLIILRIFLFESFLI